jgi:hypothetical protein
MTTIFSKLRFKKLAAAAVLGVAALAPTAFAGDRENVNVGVYGDNHGNFGINFDFFKHDRRPDPVVVQRTDRVWVEPVYQTNCERVWVEPVYRTVCDRVWVAPVTRDNCERVWVEAVYETRESVTWYRGRRVVERVRVCVSPAHFEDRKSTVVVAEGHWDNVERKELVTAGHFQDVQRQVCVTPGHWEERVVQTTVDHGHGWDRGHDNDRHDRYTDVSYDRGDRYGR